MDKKFSRGLLWGLVFAALFSGGIAAALWILRKQRQQIQYRYTFEDGHPRVEVKGNPWIDLRKEA